MIHYKVAFILSFLCVNQAFAQSGPAGVGNSSNNVLWLRADKGPSSTTSGTAINYWNDQSGNAIHVGQTTAAQQPLYRTNILNGNPAIEFDNNSTSNQNDFLTAPDNVLLDSTNGYTFFTVTRMKNLDASTARSIICKRTAIDTDEAFMLFYYTSNYFYCDIDGLADRFNTASPAYANNTNYLIDVVYDGTLAAASRSKVFDGETLRKTSTESSSAIPNKVSPLLIGSTHVGDSRSFGGYIAEIIMYRTALNSACRTIINNYLAAKYDVTLAANDRYAGDSNVNGDFDRDVSGVGRDSSGSNTSFDASTAAGLKLSVNSGLDIGDYIMAGHKTVQNVQTVWDIAGMTGTYNARWMRIWYLDVTNTSTTINANVEFDMTDGGMSPVMGDTSAYVLLYRATQSGNWTELKTADAMAGDKVKFNNINLTNDGYYTLGTHNYVTTPLPVELMQFNADLKNEQVDITWQTASEINNAYFITERSRDGEHFEELHKTPGAGNSNTVLNYADADMAPYEGVSYYRLKQVDFNGDVYYSPAVDINYYKRSVDLEIYPNPLTGTSLTVRFNLPQNEQAQLIIFASDGRKVFEKPVAGNGNNEAVETINTEFSPGIYTVELLLPDEKVVRRLVVK